jgi:hypothetical protein
MEKHCLEKPIEIRAWQAGRESHCEYMTACTEEGLRILLMCSKFPTSPRSFSAEMRVSSLFRRSQGEQDISVQT